MRGIQHELNDQALKTKELPRVRLQAHDKRSEERQRYCGSGYFQVVGKTCRPDGAFAMC